MSRPSSNPSVFHEPWMSPQAPLPASPSRPDAGADDDFADPDNPYAPPSAKASAFRPGEDIWAAPPFRAIDHPDAPPRRSWLGGLLAFWRSLAGSPEPEQPRGYWGPR